MTNVQEKINQLQTIEQNLQHLLQQRQQFQMQLMEVESAQEEIQKTEKVYKIIGNIMIAAEKSSLDKDLSEKKERVALRMKSIEKQETKLKEQAKTLREEVMQNMQKK